MNKQINILLGIIFVFLIGVRIYVADSVSTAGGELQKLTNELSSITQENEQLRVELLTLSSLSNIELKAGELGYAHHSFEFLESQSLALR